MTQVATTPTVTIGMPAYNGETYIRKALNSLLAQTFTDFELIVSDDASTDGTESICRDYAARDARIRYVRQSKNLGVSLNCQFVLDNASGRYFMWADDNDSWYPDYIAECVKALQADPTIAFAATKYKVTSRFSFLFDRVFVPSLSFVTDPDPRERVMNYARRAAGTHKDNLYYSLWNRDAIATLMSNVKTSALGKIIVGGPMNDYALALYRGGFIDKVLWRKTYRYIPPGHALNPFVGPITRLISRIKKTREYHYSRDPSKFHLNNLLPGKEHLDSIEILLRLAEFEEAFIEKVIVENMRHLKID